jgi:hypoxanthine-DNA glycosylase
LAHGFRRLLETVAQHPRHGDHLLAAQTHFDEDLRAGRGFAVGPQQDGRIGIVRPWHPKCALDRLEQLQIDAGFIADLAGGHIPTVIADDATRRQEHRRDGAPNLVDREALLKQPFDEFSPFGARLSIEAVEQAFDVDVFGHGPNVYRRQGAVFAFVTTPLLHGLPPIIDDGAQSLILGNMPSVMSLGAHAYYANPRNAFWRIMGEICGFDAAQPYDDRAAALTANGVAVWDVLRSCRRVGSLDSAVEPDSMVANDFGQLFERHPQITRVFFNGAAAEKNFNRLVHVTPDLQYRRLPSTSPAQTMRYADKLAAWREAITAR